MFLRGRRQARGNWVFVAPDISTHVRLVVGEVSRELITACINSGVYIAARSSAGRWASGGFLIVEGDIRRTTKGNAQGKGETTWSQPWRSANRALPSLVLKHAKRSLGHDSCIATLHNLPHAPCPRCKKRGILREGFEFTRDWPQESCMRVQLHDVLHHSCS